MESQSNSNQAAIIKLLPKTLSSMVEALLAETPPFVILSSPEDQDEGRIQGNSLSVTVEMTRSYDETIGNSTSVQKSRTTERLIVAHTVKPGVSSGPAKIKNALFLPDGIPTPISNAIKQEYEDEKEGKLHFDPKLLENGSHDWLSAVFDSDCVAADGKIRATHTEINFNKDTTLI